MVRTPWAFLISMSVLMTMWIISTGAVGTGDASLFEKITWPFVSGWAIFYAVRAAFRQLLLAPNEKGHPIAESGPLPSSNE